jgi:hypothetical protein
VVSNAKARKFRKSRSLVLHKPGGVIHPRIQAVAAQHFAILCVECAKNRSKIMLTDLCGRVLLHRTRSGIQGTGVKNAFYCKHLRKANGGLDYDIMASRTGNADVWGEY